MFLGTERCSRRRFGLRPHRNDACSIPVSVARWRDLPAPQDITAPEGHSFWSWCCG